MALAGALVASPNLQHAFAKPATVATAVATPGKPAAAHATLESVVAHGSLASAAASTRHAAAKAAARNTYYKVQAGDTLSKIADRYYHNADDWPWLYDQNDTTVRDPNLIYTGQTLLVPAHVPAGYVPKHAKPVTASSESSGAAAVTSGSGGQSRSGSPQGSSGSGSGSGNSGGRHSVSHSGKHERKGSPNGSDGGGAGVLGGTLGCAGLEQLWDAAGGNPADAFIAAEIAMAESGGNQYALSPTNDYGYWQINISNGSLATFDAWGNARAAIIISHDGTDWYPWTTYTSGAYHGRC